MSRIIDAIRRLGKKCTIEGHEITGETVDELIDSIAENYAGAGIPAFTVVVSETPYFIDKDGETLDKAEVFRKIANIVSIRGNMVFLDAVMEKEEEEGFTTPLVKMMWQGIDIEEGGFWFYAKTGEVEEKCFLSADTLTVTID